MDGIGSGSHPMVMMNLKSVLLLSVMYYNQKE